MWGPARWASLYQLLLLLLLHGYLCLMEALILTRGAQVVLVCQCWVQLPKARQQGTDIGQ